MAGSYEVQCYHIFNILPLRFIFKRGRTEYLFGSYSGGALVDLGVYPLSLAVGLFGEPSK